MLEVYYGLDTLIAIEKYVNFENEVMQLLPGRSSIIPYILVRSKAPKRSPLWR